MLFRLTRAISKLFKFEKKAVEHKLNRFFYVKKGEQDDRNKETSEVNH